MSDGNEPLRIRWIGDEKSKKMEKKFKNLIRTRNMGNDDGYTEVTLISKKKVRIYHEETFIKAPNIILQGNNVYFNGFIPLDENGDKEDEGGYFYSQGPYDEEMTEKIRNIFCDTSDKKLKFYLKTAAMI